MKVEIDELTTVKCKQHQNAEELDATYDISTNRILVAPCKKCMEEAKEEGALETL
jgi:hypothetical protein